MNSVWRLSTKNHTHIFYSVLTTHPRAAHGLPTRPVFGKPVAYYDFIIEHQAPGESGGFSITNSQPANRGAVKLLWSVGASSVNTRRNVRPRVGCRTRALTRYNVPMRQRVFGPRALSGTDRNTNLFNGQRIIYWSHVGCLHIAFAVDRKPTENQTSHYIGWNKISRIMNAKV